MSMTNRERLIAILSYESYDRLPIVHFGYWGETLRNWVAKGHLEESDLKGIVDGNPVDTKLNKKLGFDFAYANVFSPKNGLIENFERKIIEEFPDGSRHVMNHLGVVVLEDSEANSIPSEIDHTLKDRASWEEHYKWRYRWSEERVVKTHVVTPREVVLFSEGGLDLLRRNDHDFPRGLHCGSMFGQIRNVLGVVGASYLLVDDEKLFDEIIDTVCDMNYRNVEYVLEAGAKFDFAHFWEDICFKNGPLISPSVFKEKIGPKYKRITDLLHKYDINIVSLDCDGMIDALIPTWLENGVNTMFPIEVGTWNASIAPWRERYGKELRGVGGMNKMVFGMDRAAVDSEIERLKPLVDLGGFVPCPDHRIPPDAKFDLVRYYCERMRREFS